MKRHYDGDYMRKTLEKTLAIKREDGVDISIGADIIVWFPGETEKDFEETLELVQNYGITKLHAFPFSAHDMWESVPAGEMDHQVDGAVKKQRMNTLLAEWEKTRESFVHTQKWKELSVLIEVVKGWTQEWKGWTQGSPLQWKWWTQNYIEATQDNFEIVSGEIKKNEIVIWRLR